MPDAPFEVYDESLNATADRTINKRPDERYGHYEFDADGDLAMATASPILFKSLRTPPKTAVSQDAVSTEDSNLTDSDAKTIEQHKSGSSDQEQLTMGDGAVRNGNGDVTMTPTKIVRNLTQAQEGTLVRSALRSSLDGEDAKVLNDFLSKAMAKRAAKAALAGSHESDTADKSSSPEDSPDSECATPRSRKALEDRDANSPSPVKVQTSPSKGYSLPGDESREDAVNKETQDEDEPAPASPAYRRSARVKAPPANAPPVRNTISLRRAKGTEFVFLQRTEAQELALATRRNTRHNRGNSMMPKYALQAMAQEDSSVTDSDIQSQSQADRKTSGSRKATSKSRKNVTWNEERMVEYEGDLPTPAPSDGDVDADAKVEGDESSKHDVDGGSSRARSGAKRLEKKASSSNRSSRSQVPQKPEAESDPTAPASAVVPVSTTPTSRRVRRLGDSAMTSGTPVKTGSGRVSKPPTTSATSMAPPAAAGPSTPTKPRRKLVPKSPSSSLLSVPVSKASSNGGEQHFVSGIPTRSTASSEGTKRKSMMEANAGCTPMPRRVRARS